MSQLDPFRLHLPSQLGCVSSIAIGAVQTGNRTSRTGWLPAVKLVAAFATRWAGVLVMAAGSMIGTFVGGQLLRLVSNYILLPMLAAVLLLSAPKIWRHE